MPALANVPNVLRIDQHFQTGTIPMGGVRTFWNFGGGPPSGAECATIAGYFAATWSLYLAPLVHTNQSLILVRCTDLTSPQSFNGTWTGSDAGSRAGNELPVDNAVLVNYNIHHRYRGGKPRTYWPGGVHTDVLNGVQWQGAFVTAFQSALASYWTHIQNYVGATTISTQACVHYYKDSMPNSKGSIWDPAYIPKPYPPGTNAPIDQCYVQTVSANIGSQRRRLKAGS